MKVAFASPAYYNSTCGRLMSPVFDTTGMAIWGNVTAVKRYEMPKARGLGTCLELLKGE